MTRRRSRRGLDSCPAGTLALFLLVGLVASAAQAGVTKIYWNDNNTRALYRANPDGSGATLLIPDLGLGFWEMAVDAAAGKIYWLSRTEDSSVIRRANLDGTGAEVVLVYAPGSIDYTQGFAIDPEAGLMFWGRYWQAGIQRAKLDGTGATFILSWPHAGPGDIALDLGSRHIYWAEWTHGDILRADYEGNNVEVLVTGVYNIPFSLDLDLANRHMYWSDFGAGGERFIYRANLDGSGVTEIIRNVPANDLEVDAEGGKIYLVDKPGGEIRRFNLDGTGLESILTGLPDPWHAALQVDGPVALKAASWAAIKSGYYSGGK